MSSLTRLVVGAIALCPLAAHAAEPAESGRHTLLFVGGAGGEKSSPTLARLEARLRSLDPTSGLVVFTGGYSSAALPGEGEAGRAEVEAELLVHVEATREFVRRGGRVYFLPGSVDFGDGGSRVARELRRFLNRAYEDAAGDLDVMPLASCGDSTLLELNENAGLLLVNSQWWMQDWANDPQANEGCEVKTRAVFQKHLQDSLRDYRGRRLIIASHHPLRSYGELGGSFTGWAHLSPVPVVGTLWVLARQAGLVEQYQNHPMVRSYVEVAFDEAQRNGAYVFASGHDASLQYLQVDQQTQLVSGAAGRSARPTVEPRAGDFASASPGWAELTLEPSGEGEARFISGDADDRVLFQAKLPALVRLAQTDGEPPRPFPEGQVTSTYTKAEVWRMGAVMKFLVGSFYADAYQLELPYETLNLTTEQGGLTVKGPSGGTQTNSLKLRDAEGGDWVMRAVTKDSSRVLPWPQNQATLINRLLDHGYTASHPEAALAVPRLSPALGLLHAEPRLLYLPDQAALGRYRGFITDELILLERRPSAPKEGVAPASLVGEPSDAGKTHFRTTQELIDELIDEPATHRLDQEEMLRARLLDLFIGDWDRHEGQWRFAAVPQDDGSTRYAPIARDRDQVFANYDGLGFFLARLGSPAPRVMQPFTADYGSIAWLIHNARNIDPLLLNRVTRERWLAIAKEVQAALTDEVIDEALSTWHPEAYALDGARIAQALKGRRDTLLDAAAEYYALLNRDVDVLGSSGDDTFDLWFPEAGAVRVAVRRTGSADGGAPSPFYDRVFASAETSELRLYALAGDDALVVHGDAATSMVVRFVGGEGRDTVAAAAGASAEPLRARALHAYDLEDGLTIAPSIQVQDERSTVPGLNQFDQKENHDRGFGTFVPGLHVNADDGLWLGGTYAYTVQGYKKHPFAARHDVSVAFATATLGASVDYRGQFPQSAGRLDQQLDVLLKTPTYTRNFFGLTNRFVPDEASADFYRVRQAGAEGRYGLAYGFGRDWSRVGAQLVGQAIFTEATADRFVSTSPEAAGALGPRYFAGARVFAETNTFDDLALPTRGVALHASAEGRSDVEHGNELSLTWKGAAAAAFPFDRQRRFVLITRATLEGIVGPHPFYFAPTLGGTNLRAYRFQQLAGEVAFAQTTDLRIDVVRVYSVLPGTIGVNLALDHGRVFGPSIVGSDYHLNYGGGVWWSILDTVGVSLGYFRGLDGGSRFVFAVGPLFSQTGF